jgi:hypothetical protein
VPDDRRKTRQHVFDPVVELGAQQVLTLFGLLDRKQQDGRTNRLPRLERQQDDEDDHHRECHERGDAFDDLAPRRRLAQALARPITIPFHEDNQTVIKERFYLDKVDRNTLYDEVAVIDHAMTRPCTKVQKAVR